MGESDLSNATATDISASRVKAPSTTGTGADRTAAGLEFQRYSQGLTARGSNLGIGRRTAPPSESLFSSLSGSQFGNGNAKSTTAKVE
jgi:hypothetical protein